MSVHARGTVSLSLKVLIHGTAEEGHLVSSNASKYPGSRQGSLWDI